MQWYTCMDLVLQTLQSSLPVWAEEEATRTEIHLPYSLLQRVWLAFGWRGEEGGHQEVNFRTSRAHQWHLLHKKWHSVPQRYVPSENRFLTALPVLLLCTSSRFNSVQMPKDFKWVFLIYFSTLLSSITLDYKLRREFACGFFGDDSSLSLNLFNASWNDVLPRIFKKPWHWAQRLRSCLVWLTNGTRSTAHHNVVVKRVPVLLSNHDVSLNGFIRINPNLCKLCFALLFTHWICS